jgi:mRNA-degrading endonuclease toxin of MazEF toxin-antitoxin module
VQIDLSEKVAFDFYEDNKNTGAFILIDKITNNTVAAGMIVGEATKSIETKEDIEFDKWNEIKKDINKKDIIRSFEERQIIYLKVGKNIGFEQDGKGDEFLRPVLIYKKFNNNQFIAFAMTSQNPNPKNAKYYYQIKDKSYVILSQIKTYSAKRISHIIGKISKNKMKEIHRQFVDLVTPS